MIRSLAQKTSLFVVATLLVGCADTMSPGGDQAARDEEWVAAYGVDGGIEPGSMDGKEDSVTGPLVSWENTDTVWRVTHAWTDVTNEAGIAWSADSGLTWEQKYEAWIGSLPTTSRGAGGTTFEVTTPYGVTLPAPVLECAEVAIFLRGAFASWYGLPFYLKAYSSQSRQNIYLGHFGFRNADGSRFSSTRNFRSSYHDYTGEWDGSGDWPSDSALRGRGLYGGGDEVAFLPQVNGEPARAGAYFDALFLNKRVGHWMLLAMSWFGSINLASETNMVHIVPEATRAGDVLLHRWQSNGIGHTIPVMRVERPLENRLRISVATGSMPRRQPVWEEGASVLWYFTSDDSGGPGENTDGDAYASMGGGIRRWRIAVRSGSRYRGTVSDPTVQISRSDTAAIAGRPARFQELLGNVSPAAMRDAALGRIQAARAHLAMYPASCSARERREQGFDTLYDIMSEHFGTSRSAVDAEYRRLEDYVFAELEYNQSRSCCWNSSTAAMYEIIMSFAEAEQAAASNECIQPSAFMGRNNGTAGDGFQMYAEYAESIGRGGEWVPWSADESCPQRNVRNDTERAHDWTPYCDLSDAPGPGGGGGSCDDGNDTPGSATPLTAGRPVDGSVCNGTEADHYRITLSSRSTVEIDLTFRHSDGDLDIVLLDSNNQRVALSQSSTDNESIVSTLAAGTYIAKVYGWNGATADYRIALRLRDAGGDSALCGDAGSSFGTAAALSGSRQDLRVCGGESDYWRFTPLADGRLRVRISFQHSRGDLDLAVYRTAQERIGLSQGTTDTEQIEIDVQRNQPIVIHVYGYNGAAGDYDLEVTEI